MAVKVYKLEDGNYALVESAEAEKIKTIDDLKAQNLLLAITGAVLAIPAAIVTSEALAVILALSGITVTIKNLINNEAIRRFEGKDIDFMYILNQGLAVPGVLLPGASMAARGLQKSMTIVQTLDGLGTGYSLATGPASIGLSVPDLYKDRQQYYIDRGEDFNYEKWNAALQFRILNNWRGPESYRGDALKKFEDREAFISGDGAIKIETPTDVTQNVPPPLGVADTLYDFEGNPINLNLIQPDQATKTLETSQRFMNMWDSWNSSPLVMADMNRPFSFAASRPTEPIPEIVVEIDGRTYQGEVYYEYDD